MGEVNSNWNAIYNELLRWQNLLEKSSLIKHIPYSRGTGLMYDDEQERMREGDSDLSTFAKKTEREEKPSNTKPNSEE